MVELTKYNEQKFLLNCDLIETIEETDYELLTETTLKIGSLTFGPY